jgi:hypothetical protein
MESSSWGTPRLGEARDRINALLANDVLLDIVKHIYLSMTVRVAALARKWWHIPRSLSNPRIDV